MGGGVFPNQNLVSGVGSGQVPRGVDTPGAPPMDGPVPPRGPTSPLGVGLRRPIPSLFYKKEDGHKRNMRSLSCNKN